MEAVLRISFQSPARAKLARGLVVAAHGKAVSAAARGKVLEVVVKGSRFADLRAKVTSLFRDLKVIIDSMALVKEK